MNALGTHADRIGTLAEQATGTTAILLRLLTRHHHGPHALLDVFRQMTVVRDQTPEVAPEKPVLTRACEILKEAIHDSVQSDWDEHLSAWQPAVVIFENGLPLVVSKSDARDAWTVTAHTDGYAYSPCKMD